MWAEFVGALVVLFALDAVLIFAPTFAPVPRKGPKPATQTADNGNRKSEKDNQPAPPSLAVKGVIQAVPSNPNAGKEAEEDKHQQETAVSVRSLPQISIAKNYPTVLQYIYDWGPWAFGLALVVVGYLQIRLLKLTMKRVSRQADVANRQAIVMVRQLKEMESTREVETRTLFLQYRPKILVRGAAVADFNFSQINEPMQGTVRFTVVNTGGTGALITGGHVRMICLDASENNSQFLEGAEELIGEFVLQPGQDTEFRRAMFTGSINSPGWIEGIQSAQFGVRRYLYLIGTIYYRDELDIPRQTSFMRNYDSKERKFVPSKNADEEYVD